MMMMKKKKKKKKKKTKMKGNSKRMMSKCRYNVHAFYHAIDSLYISTHDVESIEKEESEVCVLLLRRFDNNSSLLENAFDPTQHLEKKLSNIEYVRHGLIISVRNSFELSCTSARKQDEQKLDRCCLNCQKR